MIASGLTDLALDVPRTAAKLSLHALRWTMGLTPHRRPVGDIEWAWLEGGPADGEPLVLLHGFSGSKDNWLLYAPFMAGRYRIICPDLPGFGDSTRDGEKDHGIAAQVARLAAFLDMLGIERCHLGGNSLGGYVALAFALEYPERIVSLGLFNNAGVNGPERSELQEKMARGENPLQLHSRRDLDRILGLVIHRPPYIPLLVKYIILAEHRRYGALLNRIFGQIIGDALERPLDDRLGELDIPTIIFWGEQDRLLHVSAAAFQNERIAGSELVIFEDVGHVPMIERPWSTAQHHRDFLDRLTTSAAKSAGQLSLP
jgi:abhydrolase domain-containing protein 6